MKSVITFTTFVVLVCFLLTFAVATNEVSSVNIVGYAKRSLPTNTWIMAAIPFDKVGGGTNTLLDIFGTNQLAQNDNQLLCDRIVLWSTAVQKYRTYAQWTDGVFYRADNAAVWGSGIVENAKVPPGVGMWIVPKSGASSVKDLTFMGQVIATGTQAMSIVSGWQLASYPYTADIPLQDTKLAANGAAANDNQLLCDRVVVWETNRYQTYALWTDHKWYKANNATEWGKGIEASNGLSMTEGFWYIGQSNIVWSETNRYLSALQ